MSIFAPLTIGKQGLLANQRALGVTGHNIANVNTPGYSRQTPVLHASRPDDRGFGTGVVVESVLRSVDGLLDARMLSAASALGGATTGRELLDRVQALFPVGDEGIGDALAEFFATANAVADSPQDLAARNELIEAGATLAGQLRNAAGGLQVLQREADDRLGQAASDANGTLQTIAQLNREIVAADCAGRESNDLRDQRQAALGELAKQLSVQVVEVENGGVNVFAASGQGLVIGADAATLTTERDLAALGLDGNPLSRIGIMARDGSVISLAGDIGGTIGTALALRDQTIADDAGRLDLLATTLRDAVNAVQTNAAGRDLDGNVGTAFFSGTGAADLRVALSDPRAIAAAQGANPADNTNALAFGAIAQQTFPALGGSTLGAYFGTLHARVGQDARRAEQQATIEQNVSAALGAQREAVSGVSLDEEFTNLIRFQRGYQASAQLISVSNQMLDDLLGLVS
ncbi:MAG: flagellar hook-associated protein FlgK [Deltaproteobacteria bacterium]|nr:flagellar hook-associated protein FlgK [Deltaproteobacteria bacterium]